MRLLLTLIIICILIFFMLSKNREDFDNRIIQKVYLNYLTNFNNLDYEEEK